MYKLELVYAWYGGTRPCPMGVVVPRTHYGCMGEGGGGIRLQEGNEGMICLGWRDVQI